MVPRRSSNMCQDVSSTAPIEAGCTDSARFWLHLHVIRKTYPWAYRIKQWERINGRPHPLRSRLSALGEEGLDHASEIAGAARARSFAAIGHEHPHHDADAVTAEVLARESCGLASPSTIRSRIRQTQFELFGSRSDRSIRRFLARVERDAGRSCEADGCTTLLPVGSTVLRRFCEWHSQPWAKSERHRATCRPPEP